jgi:hypothetical protein
MRQSFQQFGRIGWIRPALMLLLICHLGRFYSDAPLALAICFEHNHSGLDAHEFITADGHAAHQIESAAPASDDNSGFKLQHCKDTYQGMNLIPTSVLSVPAGKALIAPPLASLMFGQEATRRYLDPTNSIFHPPQLFS